MIGVFDSGFGGLTVHRALIEALPGRDFVYLGDNRNAPYGVRPPIDVLNLTCAALERLFAEGCTLAVVACNTASTVALRWIQQQWLPARRRDDGIARNAIGIVVPTIEAATGIGWDEDGWDEDGPAVQPTKPSSTIAAFATRRTVETDWYPIEIRKRRPASSRFTRTRRPIRKRTVNKTRQRTRVRNSRLHPLPASRRSLRRRSAVWCADDPPVGRHCSRAEGLS